MKKLIVAFAAVAMAVAAQAAVVSWGSGTITAHSTGATATANLVTMYCWDVSAEEYATYASLSGTALSDAIAAAYDTTTAEKAFNSVARGGLATGNGTTTHNAGDKIYGVVLFTDNTDNYYLGNVVAGTVPDSGNGKFQNLFTTYQGTVSGGTLAWSTAAVPEPTSGLLLLLGMAGLALKRKRA